MPTADFRLRRWALLLVGRELDGGIDFLAQDQGAVYAMEVKAEENLRAKSLRAFKQANPQVKAVRFSLSPYRQQDWMRNVPLYAVANKGLWG